MGNELTNNKKDNSNRRNEITKILYQNSTDDSECMSIGNIAKQLNVI
jgi:hypothetical protein